MQYLSNLTAASFWPPPPWVARKQINVAPVFPQKQKAQNRLKALEHNLAIVL